MGSPAAKGLNLVISHTAVFGVLSGALSEAIEGIVSWVNPVRSEEAVEPTVDLGLSERLTGKAEKGGVWLLGV